MIIDLLNAQIPTTWHVTCLCWDFNHDLWEVWIHETDSSTAIKATGPTIEEAFSDAWIKIQKEDYWSPIFVNEPKVPKLNLTDLDLPKVKHDLKRI